MTCHVLMARFLSRSHSASLCPCSQTETARRSPADPSLPTNLRAKQERSRVRARYRAGKASWWRVYGVAEDAAMPVNRQNAGRFCRAKACVEENSQMLADGARARLSALNDLTTFVH